MAQKLKPGMLNPSGKKDPLVFSLMYMKYVRERDEDNFLK